VEVGDERLRPRTTVLAVGVEAAQMAAAVGLLAPFHPGHFAERATRVMLEVESVFREPTRQDRSS
jgi:hypothetical protein